MKKWCKCGTSSISQHNISISLSFIFPSLFSAEILHIRQLKSIALPIVCVTPCLSEIIITIIHLTFILAGWMNSTSSAINDCKKHLKKRKKAYSDESILYYLYYNRVGKKSRCYTTYIIWNAEYICTIFIYLISYQSKRKGQAIKMHCTRAALNPPKSG